jgi:hypothetical protein
MLRVVNRRVHRPLRTGVDRPKCILLLFLKLTLGLVLHLLLVLDEAAYSLEVHDTNLFEQTKTLS